MSAAPPLRPLVGYLHRLAARDEASDRQLLERFARQHDEDAFRTLVRRHGPLGLGVCRRALRHRQDAEDCFQATFLVLARKAGRVRWHESAAGWLYQVATRLAAELRVREARRQRREREAAADLATTASDPAGLRELGAALDEELHRLPERLRDPALLCYVQGQTRDRAARTLGLPLRTLERRLHEARERLRRQLVRRGLTLSAGLLAWGMAQDASARVPAELTAAATDAALGHGPVPPRTAALAGRVVRGLVWEKVRGLAGVVVALGMFAAGLGWWQGPDRAVPQTSLAVAMPAPAKPAPPAPLQEAGTAAAVRQGLQWIVRRQTAEGGWHLDAGPPNDTAATAFGLLPLLGADDRAHGDAIRRGLKHLAGQQQADGGWAGGMYAHALATWALCEGYRRTGDASLKQPAQRAIDYIVAAQNAAGGWRYRPGDPIGDTSVSSWHIVALKQGEKAGLRVPPEALKKASAFLDTVASNEGATYAYIAHAGAGSVSMTAAGLMCRQVLGWERRHPAVLRGTARLLEQAAPAPGLANTYYYHFATRLMRQTGGAEWAAWEPKMVGVLLQRQERAGDDTGSWPAAGDVYGTAGGRLMITSLSLLILESCGRLTVPPADAPALKEGEAAGYWDDLAAADFGRVRKAIEALAGAPGQAVPVLRERLRPVMPPDAQELARRIEELGSDHFATRSAAFRALSDQGERAAAALRQALAQTRALEPRRRIEQLLAEVDAGSASPARLRQLRGVQVLELAGTPDARRLLEALAEGAPGAALTQAARDALGRLGQRPK